MVMPRITGSHSKSVARRPEVNSAFMHSCIIQRKLSVLLLCDAQNAGEKLREHAEANTRRASYAEASQKRWHRHQTQNPIAPTQSKRTNEIAKMSHRRDPSLCVFQYACVTSARVIRFVGLCLCKQHDEDIESGTHFDDFAGCDEIANGGATRKLLPTVRLSKTFTTYHMIFAENTGT